LTEIENDSWIGLLNAAADVPADSGGAAGLGGSFDKLWNGAKNVLRIATYWEMKNRAGVIGKGSLGPLLGKVHDTSPYLKFHLLGHSFGARLVSYALAGLPDSMIGTKSPVKLLFLLQGAFSHFAFSPQLPFDKSRSGDLSGMSQRVDGPLITTHSKRDTAVGVAYPAASFLAGADASDVTDVMYRWEGMGCDGAQAVDAVSQTLGEVSTKNSFAPGVWLNLDGDDVITAGGPPSGAHSDIVHPETAWVALAGAGIIL
jgi:pimeloyl-ACP methyl ester carboxylesterase